MLIFENGSWINANNGLCEVITQSSTDTLTNTIIDSTSNTVTADKLRTTTGTVIISLTTAPSAGQILVATESTSASYGNQQI